MLLFSDTSKEGWGAHLQGLLALGNCSQEERCLHINLLEMNAIFPPLHTVGLMNCNSSVVACMNKQGETILSSLYHHARQALAWATQSSGPSDGDRLVPSSTGRSKSISDMGQSSSGIICISSEQENTGVMFPSSWSMAWQEDAFLVPWDNLDAYDFPPFSLIRVVMTQLMTS